MGKKKHGRRRLLGRGVTDKKVKEVNGGSAYVVSGAVIDDLRTSLLGEMIKEAELERVKLKEMYKQQEVENLKERAELINMQTNLENQKQEMTEDILTKIIAKLPSNLVKQYLCPPSDSSSLVDE